MSRVVRLVSRTRPLIWFAVIGAFLVMAVVIYSPVVSILISGTAFDPLSSWERASGNRTECGRRPSRHAVRVGSSILLSQCVYRSISTPP